MPAAFAERSEAPPTRDCPACGSPARATQAYCLECGSRLGRGPGPRDAVAVWRRGAPWYATEWVWPALGALVIAVMVATVAVAFRLAEDDEPAATAVATLPQTSAPVDDVVLPTPEPPPAANPPPAEPAPPAPAQPARRDVLVVWPAASDGWTVVLASLPKLAGREAAIGRAKAATEAGIANVGILDADEFSSFHPDYFVVFSGVHRTLTAAERASRVAHDKGYRDAYPREVAR
jgi:hypothetical protein